MWKEKKAAGAFFFFSMLYPLDCFTYNSQFLNERAEGQVSTRCRLTSTSIKILVLSQRCENSSTFFKRESQETEKTEEWKKKVIDNCRNSHKMSQEKETWQHVRLDVHARLFFFFTRANSRGAADQTASHVCLTKTCATRGNLQV